ncbi:MAG TPA: hypothetical protein VLG50_05320 [Candidatus Saccharimonadales bacterium]|nr:hypothetical protein [Candidatus Saccharimonadales bacterium]
MSCYCNDTTKTKEYECVICGVKETHMMSEAERLWECHKKIIMICGMPDFVCQSCRHDGWYSTKGDGGGRVEHLNYKTNEKKPINKFI